MRNNHACTLVEALVTLAVVGVFLGGLYETTWRAMGLMKAGVDGIAVTRLMEARLECMRNSTFSVITSGTGIASTISSGTVYLPSGLGGLKEVITVKEYADQRNLSAPQYLHYDSTEYVSATSNNGVTTPYGGYGEIGQWTGPVQVTVSETWKPTFNTTWVTRQMSTLITAGGILAPAN